MAVQELADKLMTVPEAAVYLNRNRATLRAAVTRGRIPHARIGRDERRGGIIVLHIEDVRAYGRKNGIQMKQPA